MKKIVLILLLLLVVGWAAAAWFIGGSVEKSLTSTMESMAREMSGSSGAGDPAVGFETTEFKRGFLSSTAKTRITVQGLPAEVFDIILDSKIHHGPLMLTQHGVKVGGIYSISTLNTDVLPEEAKDAIVKGFDGDPPLEIGMLSSFGGAIDAVGTVPLYRYTSEDDNGEKTRIEFDGATMNLHMEDAEAGGLTGDIEVGEIKISEVDGATTMTVQPGKGTFLSKPTREGWIPEQEGELVFPTLKVAGENGDLTLTDIALRSSTKLDESGEAFEGSARFGFAGGTGTDKTGMAEGAFQALADGGYVETVYAGLNAEALAKLEKMQSEISAAGEGGGIPNLNPQQIFDAVTALFQPGMMLELRVKIGEGDKRTEAFITINYGKTAPPAAEVKTLGEFVTALSAEIDLRVSKASLPEGMAEMMLAEQIQSGMVEDRGDYLRARGELKEAQVSLNDNPLPIMDQFAPLMEMEFSLEGLMGGFMGGMGGPGGGGMGAPGEGGAPMAPDGFDAPASNPAPDGANAPSPNAAPSPVPAPQ